MDSSSLENGNKSSTSESSRDGTTTNKDSQENPNNQRVATSRASSSSTLSNNYTNNDAAFNTCSSEQSRGTLPSGEGQDNLLQKKWEEMFNLLLKYKETHGDCLVPNRYPEDPQLGNWGKCVLDMKSLMKRTITFAHVSIVLQ